MVFLLDHPISLAYIARERGRDGVLYYALMDERFNHEAIVESGEE